MSITFFKELVQCDEKILIIYVKLEEDDVRVLMKAKIIGDY